MQIANLKKYINITTRFGLTILLLSTGKSIPVEALTIEEQAKINAATSLAQHFHNRNFDIDDSGAINSGDVRTARNIVTDVLPLQTHLDSITKGRLDRDLNGVLDAEDVREVFRVVLVNYARIQREIAIQQRDEFTALLDTEKIQVESDRNRIPKMIEWSVALLKELRNIVRRVKLAGFSPEYTLEINDYMSRVASKLDPNNPSGVPIRFPQLLDEYINSRINNYQVKIDYWEDRRIALVSYREQVLAAVTLANLETLLTNFPSRGVVPNPPRLLDFSELGLWNFDGLQNGIIEQGIELAVKVLSWKSDEQIISVLRPETVPHTTPRLGLYWAGFFSQEAAASSVEANLQKIDELAFHGIRYLFRISFPPVETMDADNHSRIQRLFSALRDKDIQSEVSPLVIDDDTWIDYETWVSRDLPKYSAFSYLNGIAGIYAGHEMIKPYWNRRIRAQIFANIKNAGFLNSYVRFYYGSLDALLRPLTKTGLDHKNPLLGKWHDAAVWAGECDGLHVGLNQAGGTGFLNQPDRVRAFVKAALFRVYAKEAFPSGVTRFVHLNVPSLSELPTHVTPMQFHARIGYALAVLGQLGAADVVMLRVSSVASDGQSLDPDVIDPASGMKIYFLAIKKAKRILDEVAALGPGGIAAIPLDGEDSTQPAPKKHPNIFNPAHGQSVIIGITLNQPEPVTITIMNQRGEIVRNLLDQHYPAGDHTPSWDGRNNQGDTVASGIYLAKIKQGEKTRIIKLVVLK